jgi:four helix bundle protein
MELTKVLYAITKFLPAEEKFGLVSQMLRSAISVPSNIAEGQARKGTAEFVHFISHAEGSLDELDTQLTLCSDLGLCSAAMWKKRSG